MLLHFMKSILTRLQEVTKQKTYEHKNANCISFLIVLVKYNSHHEFNPFEVYHSIALCVFSELCNNYHNFRTFDSPPKGTSYHIRVSPIFFKPIPTSPMQPQIYFLYI